MMFIQIYDLIISPIMGIPFSGALYYEVSNVFDVIRIYPAVIRSGSIQAYWIFMDVMLIYTVTYILLLIWVDYILRNPKYFIKAPLRIL